MPVDSRHWTSVLAAVLRSDWPATVALVAVAVWLWGGIFGWWPL